ncbi:hypothetical protein DCAR_0934671 [Daucus carota subsp. sativus]|uniref:Uncharacterized protein n=1 Tax=Daucus carota subsp. sativus TaxID=79200 RepID=A0AAF0XY31_DAUCS|nr:hypothetical protein DCAR_0934671 [Daucus carota subsp. sativus]
MDEDCEVDDSYSSTKQVSGKASWLIGKGIWLGKKAVITGAVITSAPLVLPPLVVFSTLGLACSVPFGFVFATYACTQKIMSKLLPEPDSGSMFEDNMEVDDMEVVDLLQGAGAEEKGYDLEDVELVQELVAEQEYGDFFQREEERENVVEEDDLVQRAEELVYEEDEEAQVNLEQVPEEQEMKQTPAVLKEGDILQEKPVNTMAFGAASIQLDGKNNLQPEGEALSQEENILQEKPVNTMAFGVTSIQLDGKNNLQPEGEALSHEDVFCSQDGIQVYNEEPLEQEKLMVDVLKGTGMKNMLDDAITSINIHKQIPVVQEKQLKEVVEETATMIELNVNDISKPERVLTYQACVYDEKNGFSMLKEGSDEMEREMLMRNDMDGEGRNETQEGSTSQANEIYLRTNVQERPIRIIKHTHEGENKEETTKYLQVEDALSAEGTEVRDVKLSIEDMNEKPVIEMRQVVVSVHCGKKIASKQEIEDEEECNKSQKLDIKCVVKRNALDDLNSAREIADECGLDLFDHAAGDHDSYNDYNITQDDVANLPVLRVSTKVAESKHMHLQPETDTLTPPNEVLLDEENIWKQIGALRAIVGYSAPMHTTSLEELKALYIFTGVEPPPSLADNPDLVELNEKLRFLKSVVGVK